MTSRGPAPDTDPFEHDDAAYLLGALTDAERAAFEEHLSGCAACTARVAALRPVAGALAAAGRAGRDALVESLAADTAMDTEPAAGPATVETRRTRQGDRMAGLAQLVERRRRRTRWTIGGLAAVAAAVIAALVVTLAVPSPTPADTAAAQPMTPTGAVAIRATAAITAVPWGSQITVHCSYDDPSPYASPGVYALEVVDRAGESHQIGSWTLAGSSQVRFTSGTALLPDQIGAVNVVERDGTVILRLAE